MRRPNQIKIDPIQKRTLEKLHWEQRLSIREMAQRLGTSFNYLDQSMKWHSIPQLSIGKRSKLAKLTIDSKMELPKPKRKRFYSGIYSLAKHAGVRVSIRTIDKNGIEVRRVE